MPIFRVSELPKVCAYISQNLNKLRRPFFIFPYNFCLGARGSGATMPQKRSQKAKFQNFDFFTRLLCQSAWRQRFRTDFILDFKGPSSDPPSHLRAIPKNFGSRPPGRAATPKSFSPIFQILGAGANFRVRYTGNSMAHQG